MSKETPGTLTITRLRLCPSSPAVRHYGLDTYEASKGWVILLHGAVYYLYQKEKPLSVRLIAVGDGAADATVT